MVRRILIGMSEIAGYNESLEKGFRMHGVSADFISYSENKFFLRKQKILPTLITQLLARSKNGSAISFFSCGVLVVLQFLISLVKYDAFIFCYNTSLLPNNVDLPILKLLNKKIIWIFHGTDIRIPYMDGSRIAYHGGVDKLDVKSIINETKILKGKIRYIEMYSDVVIAQPCHSLLLDRPFLNECSIGYPVDKHNIEKYNSSSSKLRILHAPSDINTKGTQEIRKVVSDILLDYGEIIEYVEVSGVTHDVLIKEIIKSDIVIDQLYSDLALSVFSTESMIYGKPFIICGYPCMYPNLLEKLYPYRDGTYIPIGITHPDMFKEHFIEIISNYSKNLEIAEYNSKIFSTKFSPYFIAGIYMEIINNNRDVIDTLCIDPVINHFIHGMPNYTHGCGISEKDMNLIYNKVYSASRIGCGES